ncbi:hypothetical protein OE88DRAFT_1733672 [Heliocybe sulcata]|uniref:Uncharacterized protein n=1 Tax=Heliocybe sulcata TaxID=5364 RepID=A0A5C3N979_9AGAM|nr:hypothetical protein OE88DRAFT_1733672 [Heliocybe sulcata]
MGVQRAATLDEDVYSFVTSHCSSYRIRMALEMDTELEDIQPTHKSVLVCYRCRSKKADVNKKTTLAMLENHRVFAQKHENDKQSDVGKGQATSRRPRRTWSTPTVKVVTQRGVTELKSDPTLTQSTKLHRTGPQWTPYTAPPPSPVNPSRPTSIIHPLRPVHLPTLLANTAPKLEESLTTRAEETPLEQDEEDVDEQLTRAIAFANRRQHSPLNAVRYQTQSATVEEPPRAKPGVEGEEVDLHLARAMAFANRYHLRSSHVSLLSARDARFVQTTPPSSLGAV